MIRYNTKRYWGYSTDVKPMNAQIGDRFLELDTSKEYVFAAYNNWQYLGTGLKYYAEPSTIPNASPIATGTSSIALGDSAEANSNYMFVYGNSAGKNATGASYSNFLGRSAGSGATNATNSNFLGYQAGQSATDASSSNFFGQGAGYQAYNAYNSNFLGFTAGINATSASDSNFLGYYAGRDATRASGSTFIGQSAGQDATDATNSNFLGYWAGKGSTGARDSNFLGKFAGQGATGAGFSNFLGLYAGNGAISAGNSNFIGYQAGRDATGAYDSNFIGENAGQGAIGAYSSNFLGQNVGFFASYSFKANFFGYQAGYLATNAHDSNFIGTSAGSGATYAYQSNFLGLEAGFVATGASSSTFIGYQAGYQATNASSSTFIGGGTGFNAQNARNSVFIGEGAGTSSSNSSYSIFIGNGAGRSLGSGGAGTNNIIIGNGVSLPIAATNSLNIGGVLFGTGLYGTTGNTATISANTSGRIGIGVVASAITNTLHISGSSNPLRLQGLTASTTDLSLLSIDSNGVVHSYLISNISGGTSSGGTVSGAYLPLSGGTVSGVTLFTAGLSANTISAATYLNLPSTTGAYLPLSGGTVTGSTLFNSGLSANTISATTYYNLPSIVGLYLPLSGGTVSGKTIFQSGITANTISQTQYIDFTTGTTNPSQSGGRVFFDNTSKALSYYDIANNLTPIAMGQQLYTRVYNATGAQIDKGKVIAITGTSNGLPSAVLAVNTHQRTSARPIGLAAENIPNSSEGLVLNNGILSGISINTFANGATLYLSDTTPGSYIDSSTSLSFTARTNEIGYVLQTGSSTGKIYVNINNEDSNLSLTDIERNILEGNVISSGAYDFTGLTKVSNTIFSVAPLRGWVVKNTYDYATLPDVTNVNYSGTTGTTTPYINTADATYVLVTSSSTLLLQSDFPTAKQRRQNIYLGRVVHPNRSTIQNVNNTTDFDVSPMAAIRDLWTPIKLINQGVTPSYYSAGTLNIQTSAGALWGNGIGWYTDQENPDSVSISGTSPTTFQYRTSTGQTNGDTTVLDCTHYDVNGIITTIPGNNGSELARATNQRVYLFTSGLIRIQYGQDWYPDLTTAVAAVQSESFTEYSLIRDNAILIGIISVARSTTNLASDTQAHFTLVSKFGEQFGGTGGLSTTSLQQAYNNSSYPAEILTNSTLGGLHIKNGQGADNVSTIFEAINSGGTSTAFMRADGLVSGSSLSAYAISGVTWYGLPSSTFTGGTVNGATNFTNGLTATTISATSYSNLPNTLYTGDGTLSGNRLVNLSSYTLNFSSSTSPNTLVMSGGNVGIGTSTPTYTLDIVGSARTTGDMSINNITISRGKGNRTGNIAIGSGGVLSGANQFTGAIQNTLLGNNILTALNTITSNSVFVGNDIAITATSANQNVAIGYRAGYSFNTALDNVLVGYQSGLSMATGGRNVFVGSQAGNSNTSGNNNVFLGYQAGYNETGSNKLYISNSQTNNLIYGEFDTYRVGIGTTVLTNTFTVSATTHPVKFIGLQSASDTSVLTVDGTGEVHYAASSSLGSITWNNALTATTATTSNGYVGTASTLTTITLPTGATFGTVIEVVGTGTGLWRISQNANQSIKFGVASTATGTAGYLSATSQYDCVKMLCTSANTTFVVTSSIGNIFYN